ncbi:MAG TPA: hypothetical protein VFK23_11025 [Nitrospirota bacterium]|nr:hypothetical protein [Nitrospirota bacterium]
MKKGKMQSGILVLGTGLIIGALIAVSVPPEVSAATPCCTITSIDMKTGILTAKDTATGETFEFKLGNPAKISNIKIGDQVSTDFRNREVTVHSFQPVDGIIVTAPMPRPKIK